MQAHTDAHEQTSKLNARELLPIQAQLFGYEESGPTSLYTHSYLNGPSHWAPTC